MGNFIKNIIGFAPLEAWMYILFGIVCAVFIFGILMMIIKKKDFPIGMSTAAATVLAAIALPLIGQVLVNLNSVYFSLFILASGALLSVAGGCISMFAFQKRKKKECRTPAPAPPAPVRFDYTPDRIYTAPDPAPAPEPYSGGTSDAISPAGPETEALLTKINRICANGAPLTELRETAMQLQTERAKPENKNNPITNGKLNKALLDLINVIQKR